jgi:cell division septum initiation protein DivIVA
MSDNGTLRDFLEDVIDERNRLLRQVEILEARVMELTRELVATSLGRAMMKET